VAVLEIAPRRRSQSVAESPGAGLASSGQTFVNISRSHRVMGMATRGNRIFRSVRQRGTERKFASSEFQSQCFLVSVIRHWRPRSRSPNYLLLHCSVGGLMSYGVDLADVYRRGAGMTGQVLGGAKVSDIPFYQTKFEFVAATSLGPEFPATLLTAADEVID
jgi:hypothetical protein